MESLASYNVNQTNVSLKTTNQMANTNSKMSLQKNCVLITELYQKRYTVIYKCTQIWVQSKLRGFEKKRKIPKIRDYYGSGWVGPGLTRNFFLLGKSAQNSPKPVLIFWSSIPCVFCLYTLLKVVGYYDLSVLSMSVMVSTTKKFGWGWVHGLRPIQICFGFFEFF